MKIILSGYMGSGKTAVGNELSQVTGLRFLDLDEEISRREGRNIPEIFKTSGEIYFRKKESEVLQELINSSEDLVLSLGGGTPCYGKNLQLLQEDYEVKLIYLKTSLEELTDRLFKEMEQRPLISHLDNRELLEDFIRKHLFERTYYYNQSDKIITTDGKTVKQVAGEILEDLN
ncbi:shikimate kinase [Salinimicrobium catena]|uniref:Shikimate kinase n=1 Tax=Salinimicrobium catena TaxID=390640 RepID=A0A1H5PFI5_9FLAO|nr:shikimate kinase [Salinimicrobium catena]SDL85120.1 shikimate kinase [Salinimicrobium catena]SEF12683.1 shikimate kinase [Salinimicrobium catena]